MRLAGRRPAKLGNVHIETYTLQRADVAVTSTGEDSTMVPTGKLSLAIGAATV